MDKPSVIKIISCVLFLAAMNGCDSYQSDEELKFAVTDIEGMEYLLRDFEPFRNQLQKLIEVPVTFYAVSSRAVAAEGVKRGDIDLVLAGPSEYLLLKSITNVEIIVGLERKNYRAAIVVDGNSNIYGLSELKGKTIALGSVGSTSSHFGPMMILQKNKVPNNDIKYVHVPVGVAIEGMHNGSYSALGINYFKFRELQKNDAHSVLTDFRLLALGDRLPADLLLAGGHVNKAIVRKLRAAIINNSEDIITSIISGMNNQKYNGMVIREKVDIHEYENIRNFIFWEI